MISIDCCCKGCKKHYISLFDKESLCEPCFMKAINSYKDNPEIQAFKDKIDKLKKKRSSKWYERKKFSYYILFLMPCLYYIGLKYGLIIELIFIAFMILVTFIEPLSVWLADRF